MASRVSGEGFLILKAHFCGNQKLLRFLCGKVTVFSVAAMIKVSKHIRSNCERTAVSRDNGQEDILWKWAAVFSNAFMVAFSDISQEVLQALAKINCIIVSDK